MAMGAQRHTEDLEALKKKKKRQFKNELQFGS